MPEASSRPGSASGSCWTAAICGAKARRAVTELGTGAEAYLRLRGLPAADDAEPALLLTNAVANACPWAVAFHTWK